MIITALLKKNIEHTHDTLLVYALLEVSRGGKVIEVHILWSPLFNSMPTTPHKMPCIKITKASKESLYKNYVSMSVPIIALLITHLLSC